MGENHWDRTDTLGRCCQHCESGPTFQAWSRQQVVQAGAIVTQTISRLPDSQQVLIGHVSLMDANDKADVWLSSLASEWSVRCRGPHDVRLYTSGYGLVTTRAPLLMKKLRTMFS